MYKWVLIIWAFSFFPFVNAEAQNTSNKGKEFWIAYTGHIDTLTSKMYLYITSDVNTTADIKIGGLSINGSPFVITANQVQAVPINSSAYIGTSDATEVGKAIQVIGVQPVVVYAHIFRAARSAATLVLPTKALGREYYTSSYVQNKTPENNPGAAYSEFTIVAVEDNTLVEITPKAVELKNRRLAGQSFQITLQKGQIYQYQSETDLSGSHIISLAGTNAACKPIAVFSGSTWVGFCDDQTPSVTGGDNLYQQLYPVTAWGREFITAPFIRKPYDIFRVYFSKDNTKLTLNGIVNSASFSKGTFYEFRSATANSIKASEPISVVQYQVSQGCDPANKGFRTELAPHPGDPEMTILNPIEQTLSKITLYSARNNQTDPPTNITQHYINVVIKDQFKASFTINSLPPQGAFVRIANTEYFYLQEDVTIRSSTNPTHTLMADGGFSAIAYGYGSVESYGYLAGADAKNLYERLKISDANTNLEKTDICVGETAAFTLVLPYMPFELIWTVDGIGEAPIVNPVPNGSEVINGVTVYKFNYGKNLPFDIPHTHQIKATVVNPSPAGCDPVQDIIADFEVFGLPESRFLASIVNTCPGQPIIFTDKSSPQGKNIAKWYWDFGEGNDPVIKRSAEPFEYTYANPGEYKVRLWVESEAGCVSPVTNPVDIHINKLPGADFKFTIPSCETREIAFTDHSIAKEGNIIKWNWNFGDVNAGAGNPNVSIDQHPVHNFSRSGTYPVTLTVETDKGCSTIVEKNVVINRLPDSDFDVPDACVSDAAVKFNNTSVNAFSGLTYLWDFGDTRSGALNTSADQEGSHKYSVAGSYIVKLTVFTPEGCSVTTAHTFRVNGATPVAAFEILTIGNLCSNREIVVKDNSTIEGIDNITRLQWFFGDIMVAEQHHPAKYGTYALNYPESFTSPLSKLVRLKLIAYSGDVNGPCQNVSYRDIDLHAAPSVIFDELAPVCVNGGKIQLVAEEIGSVPGGGLFSGKAVNREGIFDPLRAGVGEWEITYTYTGVSGCINGKKQTIVVKPLPKVDIATDIYGFVDGSVQVKGSVKEAGLKFKWSPSKGLNRDDILNPIITADEDRLYRLTITSNLDCDETVFIRLHVVREIIPPNAFSPNGDGINDVWKLNHLETYPNTIVDIFNRYGEKVFFSQGYSIPFDGNYKGQALPVGTYYYMINPKNGKKIITGSLTLIR